MNYIVKTVNDNGFSCCGTLTENILVFNRISFVNCSHLPVFIFRKIKYLPENPAIPPDKNSSDLNVIFSICVATDPAYSSIMGQS